MTDKNYETMAHKYDGIKPQVTEEKLYNVYAGQEYIERGVTLNRALKILNDIAQNYSNAGIERVVIK